MQQFCPLLLKHFFSTLTFPFSGEGIFFSMPIFNYLALKLVLESKKYPCLDSNSLTSGHGPAMTFTPLPRLANAYTSLTRVLYRFIGIQK